jgi:transposase InsO family protein
MRSKAVAFLLADLGITKSHSRPYVSNDNPFSESQFKTLKYRPEFPERFVKKLPEPPLVPQAVWINPPILNNQEGVKNNRSF